MGGSAMMAKGGCAAFRRTKGYGKTYPYQKWENYPDSPLPTKDYPYQCICQAYIGAWVTILIMSPSVLFSVTDMLYNASSEYPDDYTPDWLCCIYNGSAWDIPSAIGYPMDVNNVDNMYEANDTIWQSSPTSDVPYFARTAPDGMVLERILEGQYLKTYAGDTRRQQWTGYPDSPLATVDYPYQMIIPNNLYVSKGVLYMTVFGSRLNCTGETLYYQLINGEWVLISILTPADNWIVYAPGMGGQEDQRNHAIYHEDLSTIWIYKTTTDEQDNGTAKESKRIQGAFTKLIAPPTGYQKWQNYPDSPLLTEDRPWQAIISGVAAPYETFLFLGWGDTGTDHYLWHSDYYDSEILHWSYVDIYYLNGTEWVFYASFGPTNAHYYSEYDFKECNHDIYTDQTYTTVYQAKTTPDTFYENRRINL